MINVVVAYDDNDGELGDYFKLNFDYLNKVFLGIDDVTIKSIPGLNCTEENVLKAIDLFEEEAFGFIALSHGNESQLLTDEVYVDSNNLSHFKKSLFYSTACSTAIELGKELIKNECSCYVGYSEDTFATYEDFYDIYIKCENYCIKEFLTSENTIKQSFDNMLTYFDNQINLLEKRDEILVAMELIGNKESFVLLGNKGLIKRDLEI